MQTNEPVYQQAAAARELEAIPAWTFDDGTIRREYGTDGWRSTMLLVNAIAFVAEAANHHPDLEVHWSQVIVRLHTHSAGGVTAKDIELATRIERTAMWHPESGFPGLAGQPADWIR